MTPHPGTRKTIKWGGAAVTVLLVVVWMGSGISVLGYRARARSALAEIRNGRFTFLDYGPTVPAYGQPPALYPDTPGFYFGLDNCWRVEWRFVEDVGPIHWFNFPLWVLLPIPLAPAVVVWGQDIRASRRVRLNLCTKCNYDRTGLAAGAACPECGAQGASRA